ncbi:hypothetical protein pb186bvf_016798 [Paramecium bursaria]
MYIFDIFNALILNIIFIILQYSNLEQTTQQHNLHKDYYFYIKFLSIYVCIYHIQAWEVHYTGCINEKKKYQFKQKNKTRNQSKTQIIEFKMATVMEERTESQNAYGQNIDPRLQIWNAIVQQYENEIEQLQRQIEVEQQQKELKNGQGLPQKWLKKIKNMKMGKSSKSCTICCNQFNKGDLILCLPCKHIFHDECAKPWFDRSTHCPNCRSDVIAGLKQQ